MAVGSRLRHVIESQQFSRSLLEDLFARSDEIKREPHRFTGRLNGQVMAALFYEPSTRTRLSFEAAMLRLGGQTMGTDNAREFSSAAKGETLEDTIRIVSGYADVIVVRHNEEGAAKRAEHLRELARQAGQEICQEDILSLSVGRAVYPEDGLDAEGLLAEADRRMYLEKQQQPNRKNRRLYPRMKGRITIEFRPDGSDIPVLGNLTNISLGGCYVETSIILAPDSRLLLNFSMDNNNLQAEGSVVRSDPGMGLAIKFKEGNRETRAHLQDILDFVDRATRLYDNEYLAKLGRK